MKVAAAQALAELARKEVPEVVSQAYRDEFKFGPEYIIPKPMDPRLFREAVMGLEPWLLGLSMAERISYDPERNILFSNLEGFQVRTIDSQDSGSV